MELRDLRALATGAPMSESGGGDYLRSLMVLDEAYIGMKPVADIEKAMENIRKLILSNPNANINNTKEEKALEQAIQDAFGFRSVNVYWSNQPEMNYGPMTLMSSVIFHSGSKSFIYGTNRNGFYDKEHKLRLYIQMDQTLATKCNMTAREITAILLHEIGHNFDYSPDTLFNAWFQLLNTCFSVNPIVMLGAIGGYTAANLVMEYGRGIILFANNINDILMNVIPPIGQVIRSVGRVAFNIKKFISTLFSPVTILTSIPIRLLMAPFSYLSNYFTRSKETYSDSFAAAYGYASELATGLEKLQLYTSTGKVDDPTGPIAVFYDMARLKSEMVSFALGAHRSNQQRMISMIDSLKEDLNDPNLPRDLKKELNDQLLQAESTYQKMCNLDSDQKDTFTTWFRKTVDSWYAGKPYMIVPPITDKYAK